MRPGAAGEALVVEVEEGDPRLVLDVHLSKPFRESTVTFWAFIYGVSVSFLYILMCVKPHEFMSEMFYFFSHNVFLLQ